MNFRDWKPSRTWAAAPWAVLALLLLAGTTAVAQDPGLLIPIIRQELRALGIIDDDDVFTGGGGETLAQTLVLGNTSGGTDLEISAGDTLTVIGSLDAPGAGAGSTQIGTLTYAVGSGDVVIGDTCESDLDATDIILIGQDNNLEVGAGAGSGGIFIGASMTLNMSSNCDGAVAIGKGARNPGSGGVSIGRNANGYTGVSIGDGASGVGTFSQVAIGASASSSWNGVAIGSSASNNSQADGVAVGYLSDGHQRAVAIGSQAGANGANAVAIGYQTDAHQNSICIGVNTDSTATNQFVVGALIDAMYIGYGVTNAAAPSAVLYSVTGGSGSNDTGSDLRIQSGLSTGDATHTKVEIYGTTEEASGATAQTPFLIATFNGTEAFEVEGTIRAADDFILGGSMSLQGVDGTAGDKPIVDASGNLTWESPSCAFVYMTGGTQALGTSYGTLTASFTSGELSSDWTLHGGSLEYTGTMDRVFTVSSAISFSGNADTNTDTLTWAFFVNGTLAVGTEIGRKFGASSDVGAMPLALARTFSTNDYIEIAVKIDDAGGTPEASQSISWAIR